MGEETERRVYCRVHRQYKVKDASGSFVCIACQAEAILDG